MKFLKISKATHVLILAGAIFGFQTTISTINANADNPYMEPVLQLDKEVSRFVDNELRKDQQRVSQMSCSQLKSEARQYRNRGNYWAAQVNVRGYAAQAEGNYLYEDRRLAEYSRRCG
jgi:hypothetical protein